jgi:hypothetical protein
VAPGRHAAAWFDPERPALERAILLAVAYADIFDYPLTIAELHRYLIGAAATPAAIHAALNHDHAPYPLVSSDGYVVLRGREAIVATRRRRARVAARLWPQALRYGQVIAGLPFVRMVAVTGALAMDNVDPGADIDFLIVTEPGRLWLCRALVVGLVRLAARRGDRLCPNYFLSERALALDEQTLYTAHELTQMVPIAGLATYYHMRRVNAWADAFLPNAAGRRCSHRSPGAPAARIGPAHPGRRLAGALGDGPQGTQVHPAAARRRRDRVLR